jgi:hypothetical protein
MIKTGTLIASALIAVVTFSAPSFAQSLSQYDIAQQRANDIRQLTTDSGANTINRPLDRAPKGYVAGPSAKDRQLQGLYDEHDATLD